MFTPLLSSFPLYLPVSLSGAAGFVTGLCCWHGETGLETWKKWFCHVSDRQSQQSQQLRQSVPPRALALRSLRLRAYLSPPVSLYLCLSCGSSEGGKPIPTLTKRQLAAESGDSPTCCRFFFGGTCFLPAAGCRPPSLPLPCITRCSDERTQREEATMADAVVPAAMPVGQVADAAGGQAQPQNQAEKPGVAQLVMKVCEDNFQQALVG